jgi:hypothetical protein
MKKFLASLILFIPSIVCAFELIVRADHLDRGYNIPVGTIISNVTPKISNQGDIAFKVIAHNYGDAQSIFLNGKLVYTGESEWLVTEPSFTEKNDLLFSEQIPQVSKGIFKYHVQENKTELVVNAKDYPHLESFSDAYENLAGDISFRSVNKRGLREFYIGSQMVLTESNDDIGPNYLFTPRIRTNEAGEVEIFARVRLGELYDYSEELPDQILLTTKNETKVLVEDRDANPNSNYTSIDTGFALARSTGDMAIYAKDLSDKKALVFIARDGTEKKLVSAGERGIISFDHFWPVMNGKGLIAFRAFTDLHGAPRRGIFVYNAHTDELRLVISEGEALQSDLSDTHVYYNKYENNSKPGFSGGLDINDRNELVFHAVLYDSSMQYYKGNAIYRLKL